ncbi:hypothetical protein Clacol_000895 [Clathrus columnatus]|uniref:F-box domain-containing protein n=1 Tax=Clathrus columnatus TaxID=1419009 RepID=A0AAV5A482_9AGAM|nr:hypothetical protein Clacol_000895 [Clathrus columnatus]
MPNVDDVSNFDVKKEREKLENMLDEHLITSSYIVKLKSHLNMLVPINKLPVELFIHIIRLTSKETRKKRPSYVPCTWVCHHWRSVLTQTPNLWKALQLGKAGRTGGLPITPFDHEFLKQSKSAGLDIDLWSDFDRYLPMLEEFFTKESSRIHKLNFHGDSKGSIPPVWLAKIRFPSLREFVDHSSPLTNDLYLFLPCIIASDHLETLGLQFWEHFSIKMLDQLTPKFRRLRRLSLIISKRGVIQLMLDALQNNNKLRTLKLIAPDMPAICNEIILPELEFLSTNDETLLQNVQAPKLALVECIRRLCNTPLLCPRLKYLSYKIVYWDDIILEDDENENFTEDLGKLLVECLQSRYKSYGNTLEYIVFGNCPLLPDYWLDECKRLGTTVITERGLESESEDYEGME